MHTLELTDFVAGSNGLRVLLSGHLFGRLENSIELSCSQHHNRGRSVVRRAAPEERGGRRKRDSSPTRTSTARTYHFLGRFDNFTSPCGIHVGLIRDHVCLPNTGRRVRSHELSAYAPRAGLVTMRLRVRAGAQMHDFARVAVPNAGKGQRGGGGAPRDCAGPPKAGVRRLSTASLCGLRRKSSLSLRIDSSFLQCSRQIELTATWSYCRALGLPSSAMATDFN